MPTWTEAQINLGNLQPTINWPHKIRYKETSKEI
jgi:hypothetical protein